MDFKGVYIAEYHEKRKYRIRAAMDTGADTTDFIPLFVGTREECHAELNKIKGVKLL
jgi:hypothetical protein